MTRPSGSRTNPVDCRYRGASWTTGNSRPCLAMVWRVVASSSTDNATTRMSRSASWSAARRNARSWALQYGHQPPRYSSRTSKCEGDRALGDHVGEIAPGRDELIELFVHRPEGVSDHGPVQLLADQRQVDELLHRWSGARERSPPVRAARPAPADDSRLQVTPLSFSLSGRATRAASPTATPR